MQEAVERAIATMWDRYDEPLSLDTMAGSVYLSRFYFSRLFRSTTGTSPGRFLTAVRLYKAKNLLLETDMTVTDIACNVGYHSLGTFISRFSRSVGVSPTRYRWLARHGDLALSPAGATDPRRGAVAGRATLPALDLPMQVYVGVFDTPIAQGLPATCDVLASSGPYTLRDVPEGTWHLRAAAIALDDTSSRPSARRPLAVAGHGPIVVTAGASVSVDLELRRTGVLDLPILVVLPGLDTYVRDGRNSCAAGDPAARPEAGGPGGALSGAR